MKKSFILVLICCFYIAGLSAALPRAYTQKVTALGSTLFNGQFPDVTCTSTATAPGYIVSAYITSRPTEIISTTTYLPAQIRLYRFGNGTTTPYDTRVYLQLGSFTSNWAGGETLRCTIENNNVSPSKTDFWDFLIPDNYTTALTVTTPQEMDLWPVTSYNINVTSTPTGQPIYLGGITTGFNTPHTFVEDAGYSGLFSVMNTAYTWAPNSYQVTNLAADTDINFVGTFIPITEPPILSIHQVEAGVQLYWDAFVGATSYSIFRCTDNPYGLYSLIGQTSNNSYTPLITSDREFYKIVAVSGSVESAPSDVVGFVKYSCTVGLNMVAMPMVQDITTTAEFGALFGDNINMIHIWNPGSQTWDSSVNFGGDFWDFVISIGTGSVMYVDTNSALIYFSNGSLPAANSQYDVLFGLNTVMIPLNKPNLSTTVSVGTAAGNTVNTINLWNSVTKQWDTTVNYQGTYWDPEYPTPVGTPLFIDSGISFLWPENP